MRMRWAALAVLSTLVAEVLALADTGGTVRLVAVLWFLLAVPGLALMPLIDRSARDPAPALVVATSLAVDALVATAQLVVGRISFDRTLIVLAVIAVVASSLQLVDRGWPRRRTELSVYRAPR